MSQRQPLVPMVTLSTVKGQKMQAELAKGLADLTHPPGEVCFLLIEDVPGIDGIAVLLKRQRAVHPAKPWIMDHDTEFGTFLYNALFEKESADEIIAAIRKLLEMPVGGT
jgi:hypothetical protein